MKLLMCILLLLIGSKASALTINDVKDYTKVYTVEQFDAAFQNHENIRLMADIDMTNSTCNYGSKGASNNLTHVDYNGTITGIKERVDAGSEAPYYALKNLKHVLWDDISNINLEHIVISGATSTLFAYTKDCKFNEIFIENSGTTDNSTELQALISIVDQQSNYSHIVILSSKLYWTNSEWIIYLTRDHVGAGFLAATKTGGSVDDVMVGLTCGIYGKDGRTGGLVGYAKDVTIKNVRCFATVIGYGDRCGGIVGYGENVNISDSQFYGMVKQANLTKTGFLESTLRNYDVNEYWTLYSYYALAYSPFDFYSVLHIAALSARDFAAASEALTNSTCFLTNIITSPVTCFIENAMVKFGITFAVHTVMGLWSAYTLVSFAYECIGDFSGSDEVGGIVGNITKGTVAKCSNYGMVYALDAYAGGIVGYAEKVTVTKCLNHGAVHGDEQTGGLVGCMDGGSLTHSLNIGTISCANTEYAGRIVGEAKNNAVHNNNYYADKESDIEDTGKTEGIRFNMSDFVSGAAALHMNQKLGEEVWRLEVGTSTWPSLSASKEKAPQQNDIDRSLSTVIDVKDRASLLAALVFPFADINVVADIDMDGYPAFNLSSAYMPFKGTIKGNGHHIKNIAFTQNDKTYILYGLQGLFMSVKNATCTGRILTFL